jgi:phage terminase small subunit
MVQAKERGESMLTPKQELFVKNIVLEGMNYSDAYRSAYNTENMSDKTVTEKASRLKDKDNIRARIEELRAEIDSPKIMSAIKRKEKLSMLAESDDPNVAMKAMDLLNKMDGEYIQKVVADVDTSYTINIELTDDE